MSPHDFFSESENCDAKIISTHCESNHNYNLGQNKHYQCIPMSVE